MFSSKSLKVVTIVNRKICIKIKRKCRKTVALILCIEARAILDTGTNFGKSAAKNRYICRDFSRVLIMVLKLLR
jgi:hypothetical protein